MNGTAYGPDLTLTPDQEGLLRTALASNTPNRNSPQHSKFGASSAARSNSNPKQLQQTDQNMANGPNIFASPVQDTPGSGQLGSFDESPFLDYELEDGNYDWDNSGEQLFGDLPGTESYGDGENHDKRKASVDDEDEEEGTSKRREGDDKAAKKPGRKPLTGEPTSKRKAQNRAAQRAFRERKERHLKDLETKVEDLEKASEATNHENGRLRAQVEKLNIELKEYRKRMSLNTTAASYSPPPSLSQSHSYGNAGDFQFNFPKFGDLPGSFLNNGSIAKTTSPTSMGQRSASSSTTPPGIARQQLSGASKSPSSFNGMSSTTSGQSGPSQVASNGYNNNDNNYDDLNGLFDSSVLEMASRKNSGNLLTHATSNASPARGTAKPNGVNGHAAVSTFQNNSSTSATGSPASSMSHGALDSSCGTTPESSAESPGNRKISEGGFDTTANQSKLQNNASPPTAKSPAAEVNSIDWLVQQNGGAFDPVLFGDYRDPQDNVLNNNIFGDFFNDAFLSQDFGTPYYTGEAPPPKTDLMQENKVPENVNPTSELRPEDDGKQLLACDKLWERVQSSEKVLNGEFDMDDLCSQLKSKAKCSGSGAMIDQKEVDRILGPARKDPSDPFKMFS